MMKKGLLILVCFLMVLSGIGIVSAETFSETITRGSTNQLLNYTLPITPNSIAGSYPYQIHTRNIENTAGLRALIQYSSGMVPHDGSSNAAQTAVNGSIGSMVIFTGLIGYQNVYSGGTPLYSYIYISTDNWNAGNLSGDQRLNLTYSRPAVNNFTASPPGIFSNDPGAGTSPIFLYNVGAGAIGNGLEQTIIVVPALSFPVQASRPNGLGGADISINKPSNLSSSKVTVYYSGNNVAAGDASANVEPYFNATLDSAHSLSLKISILDGAGALIGNSSVFFTTGSPITPTPTVTQTPIPTIAPGYIRTSVSIIDQEGHRIQGANINIKDIEAGTWTNSTGDADGLSYIDTLPYHTINIYGSYTAIADQYLDNALLGQETGYNGGYSYYVTLFPYVSSAVSGQTALYVEVKDAQTHSMIPYAVVEASITGGSTYVQSTGSGGIASFIVPNRTTIRLSASADGYSSASKIISSGTGSSYSTSIDIGRQIVTYTPTMTIPPGGVTRPVPLDTRSSGQKGQAGMDLLANNAESIIGFCIVLTFLGFVKMMGK